MIKPQLPLCCPSLTLNHAVHVKLELAHLRGLNNAHILKQQQRILYLYITWQYALLCCYRATGVTQQGLLSFMISFMALYVPSTPHCGFSGVSPDGNCAYVHRGSFTSKSKSVRRAISFTLFSEHDTISLHACLSVYSTWLSQAVTHPIMDRARRCLTSVIEPTPMS